MNIKQLTDEIVQAQKIDSEFRITTEHWARIALWVSMRSFILLFKSVLHYNNLFSIARSTYSF